MRVRRQESFGAGERDPMRSQHGLGGRRFLEDDCLDRVIGKIRKDEQPSSNGE